MEKSKYTVCLYHDDLAAPLAKFREFFWPRPQNSGQASTDSETLTTPQADGSEGLTSPTFLFLKDTEVLGHITTLPVRVLCHSRLSPAYWVVGFMVLPEYRNGPIGASIIKKVNETLDLAMTLTVEQAPLRIFRGLGWRHLGVLPQYVFILNAPRLFHNLRIHNIGFLNRRTGIASRVLRDAFGWPVSRHILAMLCSSLFAMLSWRTTLGGWKGSPLTVLEETEFDPSYDVLWKQVANKFIALVVRDRSYLSTRYGRQPKRYRILACRTQDGLRGFCVITTKEFQNDKRMGNIRVGTIIDCLFDPKDTFTISTLLSAAIQLFERERIDVILCTASHIQIRQALRRCGFLQIPGNLNFMYHDRLNTIDKHLHLDSWHLMRGDCDADGNL